MNPEIKQKWVDRLRSGEYKQGKGILRSKDDTFCCLGVLADIYSKEKGIPWVSCITSYRVEGHDTSLAQPIQKWAGLDYSNPKLGEDSCIGLNDGHYGDQKSFAEIADLIDKEL